MALSSDLMSQFVKATKDVSQKKEVSSTVYGTIVEYDGDKYVQLDGSELLTPYSATADTSPGDRVEVTIQNHTATVTGNVSSPGARVDDVQNIGNEVSGVVEEVSNKITEFEILIADRISIEHLEAVNARIDDLLATDVTITGRLDANEAVIEDLTAVDVEITGRLDANDVVVENLSATKLDAEIADLTYATITDLEATNADIYNLEATYGQFASLTTDKFTAIDADILRLDAVEASIESLDANKLNADVAILTYATITDLNAANANIGNLEADLGQFQTVTADTLLAINAEIQRIDAKEIDTGSLDARYANIDFANIGEAAIEEFFAKAGIVDDLIFSDGHVTGSLVGVTIKGDLIEGGTIIADKLVIQGDDGLYYKLNTNGETVEARQTEYNSLNGSIITAKSITANQIAVDDLVAFEATIGGFNITDDALYSGVKSSANNTTAGIYLDKTGQLSIGDTSNYLKYYSGDDDKWHLEISAESVKFSTSGVTVEDAIQNAQTAVDKTIKTVDVEYYLSTSAANPAGGTWSTTAPAWVDGKYMWSRTKVTLQNGTVSYTPSENGTCISGGTGAAGTSISITGTSVTYKTSSSGTTAPTGTWSTTVPSTTAGQYLWTKTVVTYSDGTTTTSYSVSRNGSNGANGNDGAAGSDGKGIKSTAIAYQTSSSGTTTPTGNWSSSVPSTSAGQYLWTRTTITYTDNTTSTAYSVSRNGSNGSNGAAGADGKGISSTEIRYQVSSSGTTTPTGTWSSTVPSTSAGQYLWTRTKITYTDSTTSTSYSVSRNGANGAAGANGADGADGKGIKSTVIRYQASSSGTTTPTGTWSSSIPSLTPGQYLWTRTVITYTDSTTSTSYSVGMIGATGATGSTGPVGATGKGVNAIVEQYYLSTSKSSCSGGSWSTTQPEYVPGRYYWTRSYITWSDGTTSTTTPSLATALNGLHESVDDLKASTEIIVGTQTASTGTWTGVASFSSLSDGQQIYYWLPYAGSGSATLNLTLSDGSTTGAKNCYYSGTTRLSTQYAAGNVIHLTYRVGAVISGSSTTYTGWWADANYDSNNYDRIRYNSSIRAASAITAGYIIVGTSDGFSHLTAGTAFDITYPILYAGSAITASSTGSNNYVSFSSAYANKNISFTGTAHSNLYLVGTLTGNLFTPADSFFTCTVPTSEDGYTYIALGLMNSTTKFILYPEHPMYRYVDGEFKALTQIAYEAYVGVEETQDTINNVDIRLNEAEATISAAAGTVTLLSQSLYGIDTDGDGVIDVEGDIGSLSARLDINSDAIEMMVSDLTKSGMYTFDSNSATYTFNTSYETNASLASRLSALSSDLDATDVYAATLKTYIEALETKTANINIGTDDSGDPCIELSVSDSEFSLRITNRTIDFMYGKRVVAYITGDQLYITKATVTSEFTIGDAELYNSEFVWKVRSNGNVGILWKG